MNVGDRIEVKETDMKPNMVNQAMDIVRDGIQKHSQDKDIASFVKDTFEQRFGPTWHCVVGRSFGSRVSYELETFVLLKANQHTVLVFKCG
uniref:Dynein light chain n=1 Tax=Meloidogyne javanica TaxID=6303 RepID=A0A915LD48_MELJA